MTYGHFLHRVHLFFVQKHTEGSSQSLTAGYFDELYTLEYLGEESGTIKLCTENLQTEILSYTERSQLEHERKLYL